MKLEIEKQYRSYLEAYRYYVWQDGYCIGSAHHTREEAEAYCDKLLEADNHLGERWEYTPKTTEVNHVAQ